MADADRLGLRFREEAAFGVIETGNQFTDLRFTGESLTAETDTIDSAEIRSDRQVIDVIRTRFAAAGDINFELSFGAFDAFLIAALQGNAFSSEVTQTDTNYSMSSGDNSIEDSSSGFVSDGFASNQWIKVSGFTGDTSNNGFYKIVSVTAGKMVLAGKTNVADAAGESVTIQMGAQIVNGTTFDSFNIEKEFTDIASEFSIFTGMAINEMSLEVATEAIVNGTFSFMGKDEASTTATSGDGSPTAAPTNAVMNTIDNVTSILENLASLDVTAFNLTLNNNLRERLIVGKLGPDSIGSGKIGVTGTLQKFFATKALMDKYLNFTATSLAIVLDDKSSNEIVIDLPRVKFTSGARVAGGQNTDILADMGFTAFRNSSEDVTVRIAKF